MDLVCKETVKKVAWVLIEKHTGLGSDFHSSKWVSQEETTVPSKELRNKVEVYVTHLMKRIQRKWIQKDFMRGVSIKLQEEQRKEDNYVPEI